MKRALQIALLLCGIGAMAGGGRSVTEGTLDTGNSSTALLGVGAGFTGTFASVPDRAMVAVSVIADQPGTLFVDWSNDCTTAGRTLSYAVSASTYLPLELTPEGQCIRVRYTNGGVGQGSFVLQTIAKTGAHGIPVSPLNTPLLPTDPVAATRAAAFGLGPDGGYVSLSASANSSLNVTVFSPDGGAGNNVTVTNNINTTIYGADGGSTVTVSGDRQGLTGIYSANAGVFLVTLGADGATGGRFWLTNTSASVNCAIRRIVFNSVSTTTLVTLTAPNFNIERMTFTGTPSGATVTPAKRDSTDAANTCTLRTAATGMTITAGAPINAFQTHSVLTGIGTSIPVDQVYPSPSAAVPERTVLRAGEGIVFRQATAGTLLDTRNVRVDVIWEEFTP